MLERKKILLFSTFLILIGIFLRFYQLNFENYWLDELIDFWVADPNISLKETFLRREEIKDQTPYLFQLLLKMCFNIFGYEPEKGRYLPFFFGVLSIPFLGILSYEVKKNSSFLVTILLVSINIYLIKYSQETRTYTLVFLLSVINLIFYYKILNSNLDFLEKIYIFFFFVMFSVLGLSTHPFVFIILFSQIIYFFYSFFIFKNKSYLFLVSIPIILIIYLFINYNYLITQLDYKEYFLVHENWKFYYNFYFSRFFGSKIMGLIYLLTLIFLVVYFRKKIFFTKNNFLLLIFILLFSYIIPLFYGLIRTPVLTDRYIIFVLIPILILISALIFEIDNKKLKVFLIIIIFVPTLINNFIELKYRENTKPEFSKLLNDLNMQETKSLSIHTSNLVLEEVVQTYVSSLKEFKDNKFKLFKINEIPISVKKIWIICYEPLVNFNCLIPIDERRNWILTNTKKNYLLSAKLIEFKL